MLRVVLYSLAYTLVRLLLEVLSVGGRSNARLRAEVLAEGCRAPRADLVATRVRRPECADLDCEASFSTL